MNAGNSRSGKHLSKSALGGGGFEGCTIQEQLVSGHSEQYPCFVFCAGTERGMQLLPRGGILFGGARMTKVVHSRKLEEDV